MLARSAETAFRHGNITGITSWAGSRSSRSWTVSLSPDGKHERLANGPGEALIAQCPRNPDGRSTMPPMLICDPEFLEAVRTARSLLRHFRPGKRSRSSNHDHRLAFVVFRRFLDLITRKIDGDALL
jgi:hypothetical protein